MSARHIISDSYLCHPLYGNCMANGKTTIRLSDEDREILTKLREQEGISTDAEMIRVLIRKAGREAGNE